VTGHTPTGASDRVQQLEASLAAAMAAMDFGACQTIKTELDQAKEADGAIGRLENELQAAMAKMDFALCQQIQQQIEAIKSGGGGGGGGEAKEAKEEQPAVAPPRPPRPDARMAEKAAAAKAAAKAAARRAAEAQARREAEEQARYGAPPPPPPGAPASESDDDDDDDVWLCSSCETLNPGGADECTLCGGGRGDDDGDSSDDSGGGSTWECATCENDVSTSLQVCELCGTERGDVPTCPTAGHAMTVSDGSGYYSSYRCNGCESSGSGERWFCSMCQDDFCFSCHACPVSGGGGGGGDGDADATCPDGHPLVLYTTPAYGTGTCDGCDRDIAHGTKVMDCRQCNYYLCNQCDDRLDGDDTSDDDDEDGGQPPNLVFEDGGLSCYYIHGTDADGGSMVVSKNGTQIADNFSIGTRIDAGQGAWYAITGKGDVYKNDAKIATGYAGGSQIAVDGSTGDWYVGGGGGVKRE
jgi:hypothetical protein